MKSLDIWFIHTYGLVYLSMINNSSFPQRSKIMVSVDCFQNKSPIKKLWKLNLFN